MACFFQKRSAPFFDYPRGDVHSQKESDPPSGLGQRQLWEIAEQGALLWDSVERPFTHEGLLDGMASLRLANKISREAEGESGGLEHKTCLSATGCSLDYTSVRGKGKMHEGHKKQTLLRGNSTTRSI